MEWVEEFLLKQEKKLLKRKLIPIKAKTENKIKTKDEELIDFCSNDYLGLNRHPYLKEKAKEYVNKYGTSSSASRLLSGNLEIQEKLEEEVAKFKKKETSIIFGSGYLANVGIIPAIALEGDVIFSDEYNHASIIDGCSLSKGRVFKFKHNDMNLLEDLLKKERKKYKKSIIIVETVYSMEGDIAPLNEIVYLGEKYDSIIIVDEAHATGVFGERGSGMVEVYGVEDRIEIIMGTFGKALGSYGAYVGCSKRMKEYLVNRCRTFIYSTALPPTVIGVNMASIEVVKKEKKRRKILQERGEFFHQILKENKIKTKSQTQIVPVIVGSNQKVIQLYQELRKNKIFALPIRYPTVPRGGERIRFSLNYYHTEEELRKVGEVLLQFLDETCNC